MNPLKPTTFTLILLALSVATFGDTLTFGGYAEGYYSHLFNGASSPVASTAVYSYNQVQAVDYNHALLTVAYENTNMHANLGLQAGTYANANYASEPSYLRSLFQANVGFKLSPNWWLDLGIMPSHIGFESAIGKDNWNLTRSLMADNSPYFETGLKLSYSDNSPLTFSALVLNGWQNISDTNTSKAFGTQVTYKATDTIVLNYSTFFGNEKPESSATSRQFHDFYLQVQVDPKTKMALLADYGCEQSVQTSNTWYALAVLGHYQLSDQWAFGGRLEYYADPSQVIVSTQTPNGFQTAGFSINADYLLMPKALIRTEVKLLKACDPVFQTAQGPTSTLTQLTTSLSMWF